MMFHDELRKRYQGPFEEERVWMTEYEGHHFDAELDEMENVVADHADRIENTLNCVSLVERQERHTQIGPSVILVLVMSRTATRETFDGAMQVIEHQIMEDLMGER